MFPLNAWINHQSVRTLIGLPLVTVVFAGTGFRWAQSLVKRSGWETSWLTGLAGAIGIIVTILGVEFMAFEPMFGTFLRLLNIPQSISGTHEEFYVVFVAWTGIVSGGCGLAVGLALKQPKLALKLLGLGMVSGIVTFLIVALVMEAFGFRVGTPRPDGFPSMPLVTLLGISVAALIGSELLGRAIARHEAPAVSHDSEH